MQNIDKALRKLSKGEMELLTPEEKTLLVDNLESTELNDFKEIIIQLTEANDDLEPDSRLKTELLQQFNKTKQTKQNNTAAEHSASSKFYFLKVAAAVLVLVAIGVSLYFSNNNATDEASVYIETEEFNQFTHTAGGKTYDYYVQAKSLDSSAPSWLLPNSNVDSVYSVYEDSPQYGYLTYATVTENKQVELNYYRDTASPIKSYTVLQGETETTLAPIAVINANTLVGQGRLNFTDNAADVNAREYYYQVTSRNDCGNLTSSSNLGRTIHLVVENDDEGLRNTLRWNKYVDWDSTVAYYNIYRTLSPFYSTTVYQQVAPDSLNDFNVFVDNISDATTSNGKFYYRVEAVQGPVLPSAVNGFPNNLTSAVSNSNIAEALQNPLMYVPNAFAPNGINNTFGPKGQFFDYTQFEMTIYNRWGEQVHLTNDINQGWDGTVDGKDASSGTYVYIIRYKDGEGKEKSKKGTLTLIR